MPKFLVVLDAPDKYEETQGVTACGPLGKLLRAMLADAGISDYEIVHAMRSRTDTDVAAARVRLKEKLDGNALSILACGDMAAKTVVGNGSLRSLRGRNLDSLIPARAAYATYSPGYVAAVPNVRPTVVADLRRARAGTEPTGEIPFSWSGAPVFGTASYDVETDYWFNGGSNVIQAAYSADVPRDTVVLRGSSDGIVRAVGSASTLVSHNGWAFDDRLTGLKSAYDTMALAYLDDESQPLGLEALCVKYLGVQGWKEARDTVVAGSDEFALYNARDAAYTLRLFHALKDRLGPRIRIADVILKPAHYALLECSRRGLYVDRGAVGQARSVYERTAIESRDVLRDLVGDSAFNPNSTAQVSQWLLAEGHNLPPTDTGKPATGDSVLASLRPTAFVTTLREYRRASKLISAFVVPYERILESTDQRVHPEYTLFRTATGRTSARSLNTQQIPRDPLIRAFAGAPSGMELWQWDYSAIEFRIAAWVAQETSIIERFALDHAWDPHAFFADIIGMSRQAAKSGNFGLLYMAKADTLQEYARKMGVNLTYKEAETVRTEWHNLYPAFRGWYLRVAQELRANGYVETFTGRRRHFGEPALLKGWKFAAALREAVNTHVQGPAADIALLGLSACHQAGLPINGFYHDAITFEFAPGEADENKEEIERLMTKVPITILKESFNVDFNMPLLVEGKRVA